MTTKNAARWAINVLHSKSGNVLNSFRLLEPSITLFEGHARALTTTAQITTAAGRTQNRNRSVTPIIANLPTLCAFDPMWVSTVRSASCCSTRWVSEKASPRRRPSSTTRRRLESDQRTGAHRGRPAPESRSARHRAYTARARSNRTLPNHFRRTAPGLERDRIPIRSDGR